MSGYATILCVDGPCKGALVPSVGQPRYNCMVQLDRLQVKHGKKRKRTKIDIYVVRQEADVNDRYARAYYVGTLGKPWTP